MKEKEMHVKIETQWREKKKKERFTDETENTKLGKEYPP